jgi:hypothetical protein
MFAFQLLLGLFMILLLLGHQSLLINHLHDILRQMEFSLFSVMVTDQGSVTHMNNQVTKALYAVEVPDPDWTTEDRGHQVQSKIMTTKSGSRLSASQVQDKG